MDGELLQCVPTVTKKAFDFGCLTEQTLVTIFLDFAVNGDGSLYATASGSRVSPIRSLPIQNIL